METKNISGKIPVELHQRMWEELERTGMKVSDFLEKVIEEHFIKQEEENFSSSDLLHQFIFFSVTKASSCRKKRKVYFHHDECFIPIYTFSAVIGSSRI